MSPGFTFFAVAENVSCSSCIFFLVFFVFPFFRIFIHSTLKLHGPSGTAAAVVLTG